MTHPMTHSMTPLVPRPSMRASQLLLAACLGLSLGGCADKGTPAADAKTDAKTDATDAKTDATDAKTDATDATDAKADATSDAKTDAKTDAGPDAGPDDGTTSSKLLAWLDPDSTAVAYLRRDRTLDGEQLATIFGLPPNLEDLVKAPSDLAWALGVLLDAEHPEVVQSWFYPDVLVMRPRVANGLYLVRRLARPAAQLREALSSDGVISEREGFDVYISRSAFPFSITFLTDDVVAFVPLREMGTGLTPLTAARDLPPSPAERELSEVLAGSRALSLVALAAGPLTHLDLDHEVARERDDAEHIRPVAKSQRACSSVQRLRDLCTHRGR